MSFADLAAVLFPGGDHRQAELAISGVSATGEPSLYEAVLVAIRSQQRAWHQVQVRAPDSEVVIRTRSGYYASSR